MQQITRGPKAPNKLCCFCKHTENNEVLYGKFHSHGEIVVHYFCLLLSSNIEQNGTDDQGILGFLPQDIVKEQKRSQRTLCYYCCRAGATVCCSASKCKKVFHLPCGLQKGSLHQFFGQFKSFCNAHRPSQRVPANVLKRLQEGDMTCTVCFEEVPTVPTRDLLWAPCCGKNAWFHRHCIQTLALSSGYFFKCPQCNDKSRFEKAMLQFGVYIPEQDASWELEPHAYEELLHRHDRCDAPTCKCPKGRDFTSVGTKWELILCRYCGAQGTHKACERRRWASFDWECGDCSAVVAKPRDENVDAASPATEGDENSLGASSSSGTASRSGTPAGDPPTLQAPPPPQTVERTAEDEIIVIDDEEEDNKLCMINEVLSIDRFNDPIPKTESEEVIVLDSDEEDSKNDVSLEARINATVQAMWPQSFAARNNVPVVQSVPVSQAVTYASPAARNVNAPQMPPLTPARGGGHYQITNPGAPQMVQGPARNNNVGFQNRSAGVVQVTPNPNSALVVGRGNANVQNRSVGMIQIGPNTNFQNRNAVANLPQGNVQNRNIAANPSQGNIQNRNMVANPNQGNFQNRNMVANPNQGNFQNRNMVANPSQGNFQNRNTVANPSQGNVQNRNMVANPSQGNVQNRNMVAIPSQGNVQNRNMVAIPTQGNIQSRNTVANLLAQRNVQNRNAPQGNFQNRNPAQPQSNVQYRMAGVGQSVANNVNSPQYVVQDSGGNLQTRNAAAPQPAYYVTNGATVGLRNFQNSNVGVHPANSQSLQALLVRKNANVGSPQFQVGTRNGGPPQSQGGARNVGSPQSQAGSRNIGVSQSQAGARNAGPGNDRAAPPVAPPQAGGGRSRRSAAAQQNNVAAPGRGRGAPQVAPAGRNAAVPPVPGRSSAAGPASRGAGAPGRPGPGTSAASAGPSQGQASNSGGFVLTKDGAAIEVVQLSNLPSDGGPLQVEGDVNVTQQPSSGSMMFMYQRPILVQTMPAATAFIPETVTEFFTAKKRRLQE